jgi:hypothetical protein
VTSLGLALLALLAPAGVDSGGPARVVVESDTSCPTAAEVEARLGLLLPPRAPGAAPERALLTEDDRSLRVRLRAANGAQVAERDVTVTASCADRANVVAVIIAAWELQQRTERVADPSLPPTARVEPSPAPTTVVAATAPRGPGGPRLELALAPGVTYAGGLEPSATLAAGVWGRRLGARLGLFGLLPRTDPLAAGQVRWTRVGATIEGALRARGRPGRLDAHAGLVLAAVVARGSGFDVDQGASGLSPGGVVGADWSFLFGRAFVGAGASLSAFPAQRLVFQGSAPVARALPRLEPSVALAVGAVF